jgi:sulfite exporter TauE/SafE/copper chaperone CopZ/plastocyanin domain-containing protein
MTTTLIRISGMTCVNCQHRIERTLKSTGGVEEATVSFNKGTASVTYDASLITREQIVRAIESLDYSVRGDDAASRSGIIGTLFIIFALYLLIRHRGASGLALALPLAEAGMSYGMLFIIGLVTSVHCVAMCGGINLSQCIGSQGETSPRPESKSAIAVPLLYNAGRVISYTVIGALVGALGSVLTISGRFQGVVQLAAGIFMVIMGITMLNIFPALRRFIPRPPKIIAERIDEQKHSGKGPLFIGLLNGFMPCGPLQAMQLYALSTGSPVSGAISMFLFSIGTVPLMFGIGAISSFLSKRFTARVLQIGAILVTVLGLTMFSNGWSLSGFSFPSLFSTLFPTTPSSRLASIGNKALVESGVQRINSTLRAGAYPAITVQQGIPVKWAIDAPAGSINGCNNRMIIREYGIEYRFKQGENIIEFTPERSGRFSYSCWMGMIRSSITVVPAGESIAGGYDALPDLEPVPAGVSVPTDAVAVAKMGEEWQTVSINLRDEGFDPALIVVQKGVPVNWIINNDSLDQGNSGLIVPAYYAQIAIDQGDTAIQFMPKNDFDFSTIDNMYYGYIKVVDDSAVIDIEAIKREAAAWETYIYPPEYFEEAGQGSSCCQ